MSTGNRYEQDFYGWAMTNAELIRQGRLAELDLDHIAEELESMGRSERQQLENRLAVLLMHLLKWRFQPGLRSRSWQLTIKEQRRRIQRLLRHNPSLRPLLEECLAESYGDARLMAERETGMPEEAFPETSPFTVDQSLDFDHWPD